MSSSYNTNNLYPKPGIFNGTYLLGSNLVVDATAGGVQIASSFFTQNDQFVLVFLDIQTANVWVTFDGSTPASGNGHLLVAGEKYFWPRSKAQAAKFLRSTGTSGSVYCTPHEV
jgi:hypothetical protein